MATSPAAEAAEAAARRSYGKLVAFLAARTRDVAAAEDALSEAFAAALADWPLRGIPRSPEAWLLTVARRRQVDAVRSRVHAEATAQHLELLQELADPQDDAAIPDDRLRPASAATSVRVRDGKTEVHNGPVIETRDELGGYYLIDVPDLDQALSWAARCPGAAHGTIEVRPIWPMGAY